MAEIKIKSNNLTTEIEKLNKLSEKINSSNISCPETIGGGRTVQEIEKLGKLYQKIYKQVGVLVSDTASFMKNVNESYQSSDNKAASSMVVK